MNEKDIDKILNVWKTENTISIPNKKELLLDIVDQVATLFTVGSFYYYVLNFEDLKMEFVHSGVREVLGIEPADFVVNDIFKKMHPEDLEKMNEKEALVFDFFYNKITPDEIFLYKTVYMLRLKHANGQYKTLLHQVKVLSTSECGKIQQVLGIHVDIGYLNIPFNHKVSFISHQRPSYHSIEPGSILDLEKKCFKNLFSKREKEIIKKMSEGIKFNEIAKLLFLSPHTISAHKKNILRKSGCKNTPELIARCFIEGVI
ncbi:MAG: LuxR C-terminal-related transcriptional regulator [Lutibacter sp.]|jgi:DNA-binding CsgD family transcriptional regulator